MTVYLLCFADRLRRDDRAYVRHYLGWCAGDPEIRLSEHRAGQGSPLVRAAVTAGLEPVIVRQWPGQTRQLERHIKRMRQLPTFCPRCNPRPRQLRYAHVPADTYATR